MAKTKIEKITNIEEQIRLLEAQRKQLVQRHNEDERKARTKRLIERGAMLESLINGADALTNEQLNTFLQKTVANDYGRRALANITAQSTAPAPADESTSTKGTG